MFDLNLTILVLVSVYKGPYFSFNLKRKVCMLTVNLPEIATLCFSCGRSILQVKISLFASLQHEFISIRIDSDCTVPFS